MYELFKGYIRSKNKSAIDKFKNKTSDELMTLDQAEAFDEYAGVLNENTVLVDVDDFNESEKLADIVEELQLDCKIISTKRGKHFYFLNNDNISKNSTGATLAIGISADIKIGKRNQYGLLKVDGKTRNVIYDISPDEDYQVIPKFLLPVKANKKFIGMQEGDGRNQELFNYILSLQKNGFTKEEIKKTITIINKFVLKKPLKKKEIETILRDEAFNKPVFYEGKTFLHDKFGDYLINEYHIKKIGSVLHYYDNGIYSNKNIEHLMIKHISNLKQQQRKEVLSYMQTKIKDNTEPSPAAFIAFKNGIYNLNTGELEKFSPDKIITNLINWDYNQNAYSELADGVLNDLACGDLKVRLLLDEMIGYCFYRRNELRKAFMLKGKRHNGKSTFLDMMKCLLGEDNISALDLSDLSHEYKASGLFGKLANLGDDIEDEYIPSAGIFKKVVSGDRMNTNVKFSAPIEFNPYCKLIFSGNTIPRLGRGRDSDAIIDRLVIIPFNAEFNKDNANFSPFIKYQLRSREVMEYLIKIGIEGLKRVLKNNSFTECEQVENELIDYESTINPILLFFEEVGNKLVDRPTKTAYRIYNEFCVENAMKPVSQIEFTKRVKDHYGYQIKVTTFEGKSMRVFREGKKK